MERLFTPLVNRLLEKFVKKSQEGNAGSFKASLSGVGGFTLHNLELDLSSVVPAKLLDCRRAFARSLHIQIPWTALNTQAIEIVLDTVEIILGDVTAEEEPNGNGLASETASEEAPETTLRSRSSGWLGGSSWLGSNLQSIALRAGLNLSFKLKNLVVKYLHRGGFVATVAIEQLVLANSDSVDWMEFVDNPEAWLTKNCVIKGLSVGLDTAVGVQSFLPLLRLTSLRVSALLPIFSYMDAADLGEDDAKVAVEVQIGNVQSSINDQQIEWVYALIGTFRGPSEAAEELQGLVPPLDSSEGAAANLSASSTIAVRAESADVNTNGDSEPVRGEMKALGVFSRIWYVAVNEAAFLKKLEAQGEGADEDLELPQPPTQAELTLAVIGLRVQLGVATRGAVTGGPSVLPFLEVELEGTQVRTASLDTVMQEFELQVQSAAIRHNVASSDTISRLLACPAGTVLESEAATDCSYAEEPVWDEVFGVHAWDVPLRSTGRLRSAANALEMQKSTSGMFSEAPCCLIHAGQMWAVISPSLQEHLRLFIAKLPQSDTLNEPESIEIAGINQTTLGDQGDGPAQWWLSGGGWDVEVDALQIALRCTMPGPNGFKEAAFLFQATDTISYHTNPTENAARPLGFQCPLVLSVVHGHWQANSNRARQSSIPGSVHVSQPFTVTGCFEEGAPTELGPFLAFSAFQVEGSGQDVAAALSCVASVLSGVKTTEQPNSAIGWAAKAQVRFSEGLHITKKPSSEDRQWEVSAGSIIIAWTAEIASTPQEESLLDAEAITALLELANFRVCASPGLLIALDVASLTVDRVPSLFGNENHSEEPPFKAPIPLAVLSSLELHSQDGLRRFSFEGLNVMARPKTTSAVMALIAHLGRRSHQPEHPSPTEPASSGEPETTKLRFGMLSFTLFPAEESFNGPSGCPLGLTGWMAGFSSDSGPISRRLAIGSLELSLCRLSSDGHSGLIELPFEKVLSFQHVPGDAIFEISSSLASDFMHQSQEQFTVAVAPVISTFTPETIATLNAFKPLPQHKDSDPDRNEEAEQLSLNNVQPGPLLHGTATMRGFKIEFAAVESWKPQKLTTDLGEESSPAFVVSSDHVFVLFHQESVSERRPWLRGSHALASSATISIVGCGARLEERVGSSTANFTQILLPADFQLCLQRWGLSGRFVAATEAKALDIKLSRRVADEAAQLAKAFAQGQQQAEVQNDEQSGRGIDSPIFEDDLRCGAFELDAVYDQALRAFGVSLRHLGSGENVVEWRYPFARDIHSIFIEIAAASDLPVFLSLSRFDESCGEFTAVELHSVSIEKIDVSGTYYIATKPVAAHLWRLCWTNRDNSSDLYDLLPHLYINPEGGAFWKTARDVMSEDLEMIVQHPTPLSTASTIAFSLGHCTFSLLAPHSNARVALPGAHMLNTLAVLHINNLVAALHQWDAGVRAVDAALNARLDYAEASTLCAATLLEPFEMRASFDVRQTGARSTEGPDLNTGGVVLLVDAAANGFATLHDGSSWKLGARQYPRASGSQLRLDVLTPLIINISELATHDLQRLLYIAKGEGAEVEEPPIRILNRTGIDLLIRQQGVKSQTTLASSSSVNFYWTVLPRLRQGAQLALQVALAHQTDPLWSVPIDAMTTRGTSIVVKGSEYSSSATLAIMVQRDEHTWEVTISPGLRIYNRQEYSVQLLFTKPTGFYECLDIEPWGDVTIPLGAGNAGSVRLSIGKQWSLELYPLRENHDVKIVDVDPNFVSELEPKPNLRDEWAVPLLAQFPGIDPCIGHVVVVIWPPVTLTNNLPGYDIVYSQKGGAQGVMGSSKTVAVPVGIDGGEATRLYAQSSQGQPEGLSTVSKESGASVVLFCPPLGENSNSFLTSQGPSSAVDSTDIIYVMSPGDAANFEMPCYGMQRKIPCFLYTEQLGNSPALRLQLIPEWSICNELLLPFHLHIAGCAPIMLPGNTATAASLSGASTNRAKLTVKYQGSDYTSSEFYLNQDQEVLLSLFPANGAPVLQTSFYVTMTLRLLPIGSFVAKKLSVSYSHYVTNETNSALAIREPILFADSGAGTLRLEAHSSLSLLIAHENLELYVHDDLGITGNKQTWYAFPQAPFEHEAKQQGRIYATHLDCPLTLSYKLVSGPASRNLIIYRDNYPPVLLKNETGESLDLSWLSGEDQIACALGPSKSIEFGVGAGLLYEGDDDDDSFLASISVESRAMRTSAGASILIRPQGQDEWNEVLLENGDILVGNLLLQIKERGSGVYVNVYECPASGSLLRNCDSTLNCLISAQELCIRVFDDERGRIVGGDILQQFCVVSFAVEKLEARLSVQEQPQCQEIVFELGVGGLRCTTSFPTEKPLLWSAAPVGSLFALDVAILDMDGLRPVTINNVAVNLPILNLQIEDSAFALYSCFKNLLHRPTGYADAFSSDPTAPIYDSREVMAGRILINNLIIGKLQALADIHLSTAKTGLPVAVDTNRSPLSIPRIAARQILLSPQTLWSALTSYVMAEALLNAPLLLGSLQLFFNPTGLVQSIKRGVASMIDLPMQGLQQGPLQFIAGVGQGSVSLVKEISGWSLSSVVGFSRAASNAIVGSFARTSENALIHAASSESEIPLQECDHVPIVYGFAHLPDHLQIDLTLSNPFGEILLFSDASSVTIYQSSAEQPSQAKFKLSLPVLLLATNAVFLYSDGGCTPSLIALLHEGSISLKDKSLEIHSQSAAPFGDLSSSGVAIIAAKFRRTSWEKIAPSLRHLAPH